MTSAVARAVQSMDEESMRLDPEHKRLQVSYFYHYNLQIIIINYCTTGATTPNSDRGTASAAS